MLDICNNHSTHHTRIRVSSKIHLRVENAFNEKKGFYAKVNLKQKKAQVYAKEQISTQEIQGIVRRSGYDPGICKKIEGR